jgi:hypothetical protein
VLLLKRQTLWQINKESSQLLCVKNTNGKEQSGAVNLTKFTKVWLTRVNFGWLSTKEWTAKMVALKETLKNSVRPRVISKRELGLVAHCVACLITSKVLGSSTSTANLTMRYA